MPAPPDCCHHEYEDGGFCRRRQADHQPEHDHPYDSGTPGDYVDTHTTPYDIARSLDEVFAAVIDMKDRRTPGWRKEPSLNYALGMFGETAEVVDIYKHRLGAGSQVKTFTKLDFGEEMADQFFYWVMTLVTEGFTLPEIIRIMREKARIVERRFDDRDRGGLGQIPMPKEQPHVSRLDEDGSP